MPIRFLVLTLFSVGFAFCANAAETAASAPAPLVLISMDAFRWDYCDLHPAETPHLRQLKETGSSAKGLIPVFPSNTFPNHYAIATGLRPAHSGVINNDMFDPVRGLFFHNSQGSAVRDSKWWGGEPIWITAVKQGLKSACSFWPGSESEVAGARPTFWKPYDYSIPFEKRLDELMSWLELPPEKRPAITTFYLEEANSVGHKFGPDSPELVGAIKVLDGRLGEIMDRIAADHLTVNYVIVSDHGMAAASAERVVLIDDYVDIKTVQVDFKGPSAGIRPMGDNTVEKLMTAFAALPPHVKAFRSDDLPEAFHMKGNPRIPAVWIVADEGWSVLYRSYFDTVKSHFSKGEHGYDPADETMRGILIVNGPAFKTGGLVIPPVENIHIYNLLCTALHLAPAPNDGDDRLVKALMSEP